MHSTFKILTLLAGCWLLAASLGCQKQAVKNTQVAIDPNAIQVVLVEAEAFPQEMVGSWYNEQYGWILKFEQDGRLLDITHTIGWQDVSAGNTGNIPLKENGTAVFEPGPWLVRYNGTTREVAVEITLKSFNYTIGGNIITGSSRDILIGTLPSPGETVWRANWVSFPEYIITTADKTYKDYRLPVENEDEDRGEIVFEKFDPEAVNNNQ